MINWRELIKKINWWESDGKRSFAFLLEIFSRYKSLYLLAFYSKFVVNRKLFYRVSLVDFRFSWLDVFYPFLLSCFCCNSHDLFF